MAYYTTNKERVASSYPLYTINATRIDAVFNLLFVSFAIYPHILECKWLSFQRQLNNYGFVHMDNDNEAAEFTCYHHLDFHQGIEDPMALNDRLPYLPTKRKNARAG